MPLMLPGIAEASSYLSWGWLSVSVPNLIVILAMLAVFILAIVVPFPRDRSAVDETGTQQ